MREREPQPTPTLREAALSYASRGWPVFRLAGKVPIIGSHGLKDATTNLQQITAWWTIVVPNVKTV